MKDKACLSAGISASHIYGLAVAELDEVIADAQSILDLGCGAGHFGQYLREIYSRRLDGVDVVKYLGFQSEFYDNFIQADLNSESQWFNTVRYDIIFAVEVIEHLENPRSFCRLAARLLKTGGRLVITTPNPTSLASLTTLVTCGMFRDFRDGTGMYPTHITPILAQDAQRILRECGLEVHSVTYSHFGRIPWTSRTYQSLFPFLRGALFSDNYRVVGCA